MYAGSSTSLLNLAGGPEAVEPTGKARAITEPSSGSQPKPTAILRETARQTLQVEPPDQGSEPRSPMAPKGAFGVAGEKPKACVLSKAKSAALPQTTPPWLSPFTAT